MPAFIALLLVFIAVACTTGSPSPETPNPESDTTALQSDVTTPATDTLHHEQQDSIQFTFLYTLSWCNGSYPPDEILADLSKPKRLYHTSLLLRSDNQTYELITDKKGRVNALPEPGTYHLFFDETGSFKKSPVTFSCDLYFARPWGEVSIGEGDTSIRMTIGFPCDLCDPDSKKRP